MANTTAQRSIEMIELEVYELVEELSDQAIKLLISACFPDFERKRVVIQQPGDEQVFVSGHWHRQMTGANWTHAVTHLWGDDLIRSVGGRSDDRKHDVFEVTEKGEQVAWLALLKKLCCDVEQLPSLPIKTMLATSCIRTRS